MANDQGTAPQGGLIAAVASFIDAQGLIPVGATILAGVSGGMDSVAMLAVLRALAGGRGWRLAIAHLNHGLRAEADEDARFVEGLAAQWGLPCTVEKADVAAFARARHMGLEQAGRHLRYEFFGREAVRREAGFVAVAHHADDNVETVLHRILRGTHIRGLAGIPVRRSLGGMAAVVCRHAESDVVGTWRQTTAAMPPIQIVRPMLAVRRSQIEEFCRAEGLSWRTDSSNQDPRFRRNYLRHHLLPLLRRHENPEVDDAILQLAAAAGQVDSLLTAQASDLLGRAVCGMGVSPMCGTGVPPVSVLSEASLSLDIAPFAANPLIVQTTALRLAMEGLGCPMQAVGRDHLESMVAVLQPHGPESISLPGGWQLVRQGERVEFRGPRGEGVPLADRSPANSAERQASPTPQGVKLPDETPAPFACPGLTVLPDGTRVRCEILPMDRPAFDRHLHGHPPGVEWLDADAVHLPLTCRPRRKGDRFHPLGAAGRQTVSNFLTNLKLPPAQRRAVRCICDETGIVYVWPLRLDHRVRATPQTRRVLRIEVTPASSLTSPGPSDRPRA